MIKFPVFRLRNISQINRKLSGNESQDVSGAVSGYLKTIETATQQQSKNLFIDRR